MSLRNRIGLFVVLALIVVSAGLIFVSLEREDLLIGQYTSTIVADRNSLWEKLNQNIVQEMEDKAWMVAEDNEALRFAVQTKNHETVQQLGAALAADLRDREVAERLDILYADTTLAYSSQSAVFQSPIISPAAARDAMQGNEGRGMRVRGIGNDRERNIALVLGLPLRVGNQVVGMGVYAIGIDRALAEMEKSTRSDMLIISRRGRPLAGSATGIWQTLEDFVNLGEVNTLQTVAVGERVYSVVVLPEIADLGTLVGRLVSVRDVTEFALEQQYVSRIAYGGVIVFIVLVLVALGFYLTRSFAPLSEGVNVLNALSRGNMNVRIEGVEGGAGEGRDEVARIASAVNVFRSNLVSFYRLRRARMRQRERQERFIRREMTQLADTLDTDERDAVLEELRQLEEQVNKSAGHDVELGQVSRNPDETGADSTQLVEQSAEGLALVALAFQKMSNRVQDQNQRLREALEAKNAFVALQRELDIASRVQLSFLPDTMLASDATEVAGFMKPAKDVGGDFYDFFRLDDHRIGLLVADVSGKGMPAALFMAMGRTLMQATARHVDEPGLVLAGVNDLLEQHNAEQLFITVFYGVLDERTGRFTYANGGHDPPILISGRRAREIPGTDGIALAMFGEQEFEDGAIDLEPGDRLVLFTDGITEAFNAEEEAFGTERLLRVADALPTNGSRQNVEEIVSKVETFVAGAPQFDDITCVVMQYNGRGGRASAPSPAAGGATDDVALGGAQGAD